MMINGLNSMRQAMLAGDHIGGVTGSRLAAQAAHAQFVAADPLERYMINIFSPTRPIIEIYPGWATFGTECTPRNPSLAYARTFLASFYDSQKRSTGIFAGMTDDQKEPFSKELFAGMVEVG